MMTVDTSDLRALREQLHRARKDIKQELAQESRRFAPMLVRSAQTHARGEVEKRIAQSGTVRIVKDGFVVSFGRTGRLSGGARLREVTRPYEFGSKSQDVPSKPYRSRSPRGRAMVVRRRTRAQLPPFNADGRFLYPALAEVTPRLVSGYVRAILNTLGE